MPKYNGHRNWNHWNVSLWINNDEGLYRTALECIRETRTRREAAELFLSLVQDTNGGKTPDGAPYTITSIMAAMVGYNERGRR